MKIFDRTDQHTLERREWELWLLTISMVFVLAAGVALLMYPMVFSRPVPLSAPAMRRIFFGYCALSLLLVFYLASRQLLLRQLRRQLIEELERNTLLRRKASLDLLGSLPRFSRFQDRLTMDFRRALSSQQPLSLLIVQLKPSADSTGQTEVDIALGDGANALVCRLRPDDSLYVFERGVFGIILPATDTSRAQEISKRLGEALTDAAGAAHRFGFQLRLLNYPEQATTAREMEEAAQAYLTANEREGRERSA